MTATLEKTVLLKLKWILIFEALFAGAYISLTRGLFVIFLVSLGYRVEAISFVVLVSAIISVLFGVLLYKRPFFLTSRVKFKLVSFHALERITWLMIPLTKSSLLISVFYSMYMIFSSFISAFLAFTIYGSLTEDDIRDVTAKRSALSGISSIFGFALGVFLLAFLSGEEKFTYIFSLGALLGFISTSLLLFLNLSHLEGASFQRVTEQPEKIFSASSFFVVLLTSSNILGIFWIPYVMYYLNGPDFLAASMNLIGTVSSIFASLVWRKRMLRTLRLGLVLNSLGPLLILATPLPTLHLPLSVYTSFTYTGASFLGIVLFARYKRWFGAVKSSVLLVILGNVAQLLAAPFGIATKESYFAAFLIVFSVKIVATLLAVVTIPEIAVVSEDVARTYSHVLFTNSVMGYRLGVEISKETILITLRLFVFSVVILTLYLIYRVLWILLL